MAAAATGGTRFFRVLFKDFDTKLSLPDVFSTQSGFPDQVSLINSTSRQSWQVDVSREEDKLYFGGDSWKELVDANALHLGHFLVFRYRGGTFFTFRVFDVNACEKVSSPYHPVLEDTDTDSDDDYVNIDATETESLDKGKQICTADTDSDDDYVDEFKRLSVSTDDDEDDEDDETETLNGEETNKNCTLTQGSPYFHVTMKKINICKPPMHLHVPARFRDDIGLTEDKRKIVIVDPKGRKWPVGCYHRYRYSGRYRFRETTLRKHWMKFVRANRLKLGDRCVFQLVSKGKRICIKMLPKNPNIQN